LENAVTRCQERARALGHDAAGNERGATAERRKALHNDLVEIDARFTSQRDVRDDRIDCAFFELCDGARDTGRIEDVEPRSKASRDGDANEVVVIHDEDAWSVGRWGSRRIDRAIVPTHPASVRAASVGAAHGFDSLSFAGRVAVALAYSLLVSCGDKESARKDVTDSASPVISASALPPPLPSASSSSGPPEDPILQKTLPEIDGDEKTIEEQRRAMFGRMRTMLDLGDGEIDAVTKLFEANRAMGQGNPKVTVHPMKRSECVARRAESGVVDRMSGICKKPYMVPLFDRSKGETERDAKACIDAYEFPGIPCEYPVTWASPRDAMFLCKAIGKRICDAHEWEGACAGSVRSQEVEYAFGKPRKASKAMHNKDRERVWSYGPTRDLDACAMGSKKSDGCTASGHAKCGSNTYPTGAFPKCRSSFGVYDLHGNVAEHMNLKPEELASRGGKGETEMKGSWFIFKAFDAHEDDCRWRAPDWHATKLDAHNGHANYHLGFRCCANVETPAP
jgi:formylglycine-generating enzyme